ncbi:uncharacterized protein [Antedon mediterranea]|uniref:uncharacterized protein n=1 Tax=Antedon mediterranea TaxID=105859 RepID=UPI003AF9B753
MMNEIVKNAQSFVEILQNTRGSEVQCWDTKDLKTALDWAKYFEEVYNKLIDKPKTMEQIDKKLKIICCIPGAAIGDTILTLQDLSQSQRLLLKNLIQNPNLPSDIFGNVLNLYTGLPEHNGHTGFDWLVQDVSESIQAKSSRACLQESMLKTNSEETACKGLKEKQEDILNARFLKQFLIHQQSNSLYPQRTSEYLDWILHRAASEPNGMRVIAMTISLPAKSDIYEKQDVDKCEQFIFAWIQKNKSKYTHQLKEENT